MDEIIEGHDHYQDRFVVTLSVFVSDSERRPSQPAPWVNDKTHRTSDTMFSSQIEKDETIDNFVSKPATPTHQNKTVPDRPMPPRPAPPSPQPIRAQVENNPPITVHSDEEQPIMQPLNKSEERTIEESVDLLNLNSMPSANVSTPSKTASSSNFDLLGGLDGGTDNSFGEFTSGVSPNLLGEPGGDSFGNISRNTSQNDFTKSNISNDLLFDPFGNADNKNGGLAGNWDNAGASKVNVTPPENQNTKPNSLFSDLGKFAFISFRLILVFFRVILVCHYEIQFVIGDLD